MTAEKSGSIQPIKPQPFSPQMRSCSLQPVKLPTKQNRLSLILLLAVPSRICTQAHSPTHPPALPAQAEVWQLHGTSKCHPNFSIGLFSTFCSPLCLPSLRTHWSTDSPIPQPMDTVTPYGHLPHRAGGSRTGGTLCQ